MATQVLKTQAKKDIPKKGRKIPFGEVANLMDCYIGESEFKVQSRYHINFPANRIMECIKPH